MAIIIIGADTRILALINKFYKTLASFADHKLMSIFQKTLKNGK